MNKYTSHHQTSEGPAAALTIGKLSVFLSSCLCGEIQCSSEEKEALAVVVPLLSLHFSLSYLSLSFDVCANESSCCRLATTSSCALRTEKWEACWLLYRLLLSIDPHCPDGIGPHESTTSSAKSSNSSPP